MSYDPFVLFRTFLNVDIHSDEQRELREFILNAQDGSVTFTNSYGETYIFTQKNKTYSISLPEGDWTGDPGVVKAFNSIAA